MSLDSLEQFAWIAATVNAAVHQHVAGVCFDIVENKT
jgi:hypothetical protein